MNIELLASITRLMRENDLNALEVRDGDKRIVLQRGFAAPAAVAAPVSTHTVPTGGAAPVPLPGPTPPDDDAHLAAIKSPMVGTVYLKPSPDARPYISVGSSVGGETVVCLIEAMKVFNEIKAETSGTIAKILVSDGQTVEFGQALFLVK